MDLLEPRVRNEWRFWIGFALAAVVFTSSPGCGHTGSKSGGSDEDPDPLNPAKTIASRLALDAQGTFQNESVAAGARADFVYVLDTPSSEGPFEGISFDIRDSLTHLTVANPSPASAPARAAQADRAPAAATAGSTAEVTVHVASAADEATVCDTGYVYGPFTIPIDGSDSEDDHAGAAPATVQTINQGDASFCISIVPTESVVLSLDQVALDVDECDVEADDLEGIWKGEYSCDDGCGDDSSGDIRFEVLQDGFNASYFELDGGGGEFRGIVCGSRFRFNGGYGCNGLVCDEIEKGTFTRIAKNKAVKKSKYQYYNFARNRICKGSCEDHITRVSN